MPLLKYGQEGESIQRILVRGASGAFVVKIGGVLSAFFLQVLLARVLGVEEFGIYIYALTWMNFGSMLGRLGIETAGLRLIAAYNAREEWGLFKGVFFGRVRQGGTVLEWSACLDDSVYDYDLRVRLLTEGPNSPLQGAGFVIE